MEANTILYADLLDILFDGKNKEYGAYQLRKKYPDAMAKALLSIAALLLLFWAGNLLAHKMVRKSKAEIWWKEVSIGEIKEDKLPEPPALKPLPKTVLPKKVNQVKYVTLKVVDDKEVNPDEKIEDISETQVISTETIKSEITTQVIKVPVKEEGTHVLDDAGKSSDKEIDFVKVEVEASFPGGQVAWIRYLKSKLNANEPVENGASPGIYQVIIKFIVSKTGAISEIKAETSYGYGMEVEAIRVIKNGPKWVPALQNGTYVNAYRSQPITFQVNEE